MLQNDLHQLGGSDLEGQVQCIDTIGGCFDTLYKMGLVQSGGFVYDEFLFGPEQGGVVADSRRKFWPSIDAHPPRLFIVTDDLFPSGPGGFLKLERWPQFATYLRQDYRLCAEGKPTNAVRWWSRSEQPHSYRIYCRNVPQPDGQQPRSK